MRSVSTGYKNPHLDKTINDFVRKLNMIDGVFTMTSCGGHEKPRGSQCPKGNFWVIMYIKNPVFLEKLISFILDECIENSGLTPSPTGHWNTFGFEYNKMFGTWCIYGYLRDLYTLLEPWVEDHIGWWPPDGSMIRNCKPEDQWGVFFTPDDVMPRWSGDGHS